MARVRKSADLMGPCVPVGTLEPWTFGPRLCRCGEKVWPVRCSPGINDWSYADATGAVLQTRNAVAGLANVPQDRSLDAWLVELRAQVKDDPKAAGVYSQLTASLALGQYSTYHLHSATGEFVGEDRPTRACPECHGSPMWASPDGWQCRVTKRMFDYTEGGGA